MSITHARGLTRPIWSKADLVLSVRLVYLLIQSRRIWLRYFTFCGRSIQLPSGVNPSGAVVRTDRMLKVFWRLWANPLHSLARSIQSI